MKLKDQTAIVTGAGRGIGRAAALAFAHSGLTRFTSKKGIFPPKQGLVEPKLFLRKNQHTGQKPLVVEQRKLHFMRKSKQNP